MVFSCETVLEQEGISMNKKKSIIGVVVSVSAIIIIAKLLAFVKQVVMANAFGATLQTDLISLAQGLVLNLDYLLAQTLITSFVPTYIKLSTDNELAVKEFTSKVIKVFLGITVVLTIIILFLSIPIAKIIAPAYSGEDTILLAKYLRISAPTLVFIVQIAIQNAILKANERFVPGEFVSIIQSIIYIVLILTIGKRIGPETLIIACYGYAIINTVYLLIYSRKYISKSLGNPLKDSHVRELLSMMMPLLLGYSVVFLNQQIDSVIVSVIGEGTVTALAYAATLSNFISTFTGAVCGVIFTYISKAIAERDEKEAANLVSDSLIKLITVLLPVSILTVINAKDIVTIAFMRGAFDETAVTNSAMALSGYGFVFVPYAFRELFSRLQYAYGDSKKPMMNSTIAIACNIGLSILLSQFLGILGVTIATSISVFICGMLNVKTSKEKNKYFDFKRLTRFIIPWIIGVVICASVGIAGQHLLANIKNWMRFGIIVVVAIVAYSIPLHSVIFPFVKKFLKK